MDDPRPIADLIRDRHSVRSFLPDPVPDEIVREVFDVARLVPSNSNSQPWHVAVVSGPARQRLQERLLAEVDGGRPPEPAFPPAAIGFDEHHVTRQRRNAADLGDLMGIAYDDADGRVRLKRRNWCFYDAPHAAFFSLPVTMGVANAVDLGIIVQSVMLLMAERGVATCPQGSLAMHPGPIHEIASIPDGHGIVCGMSFGYEDPDATVNQLRNAREPLDRVVSFTR